MAQLTGRANPFAVDPSDEIPVGLQLRLRLRALIRTGRIAAGDAMPSVRQLSGWAGVNLNTVRAVYADLEEEGLVIGRQGRGTFVAESVEVAPELERLAAEALQGAIDAGLPPRDLADVILACVGIPDGLLGSGSDPVGQPETVDAEVLEVRRELRRQIGRLEAELVGYTRDLPADMPTAPRVGAAHLAGVEELEETRDILIARLSEARLAAEERIRKEARRRAREEGPVEVVDDPGGPLARATGWWLDKR